MEGKLLQNPHDLLLAQSPRFIDEVYLNRQSALGRKFDERHQPHHRGALAGHHKLG